MTARPAPSPSITAGPDHIGLAAVALVLACCLMASAGRVWAQEPPRRPGAERQVVVQLAYTLGEAHALHRLCSGPADATWYVRMQRLEAQEATDEEARRQLIDSFNAGFAAQQAEVFNCGRRSRAAERQVAQQGAALAERLAEPTETPP